MYELILRNFYDGSKLGPIELGEVSAGDGRGSKALLIAAMRTERSN